MADESKQIYDSREWHTGDIITADALNKIENEMEYVSAEVTNAVTGTINDQKLNDTIARKLDSIVTYFLDKPTKENLENVRLYVQPEENDGEIIVPTIDDYQTFKANFVQPYTNKTYAIGDYVEYDDVIYKVISAITKNGNLTDDEAWAALSAQTPSPVKEINVMKEVGNLNNIKDKLYNFKSAIGFEQTDYYTEFYSQSYEDALAQLKSVNTAGTWNDNVYTTTGSGTVTVNQDLTFTVDNSQSSNSAIMWLPYFPLASDEHVYIINRSNIRCTLYKVSANSGNVTNGVFEYTATIADDYRMAVRAAAGTSGTIPHLMVTKVLPLSYQVQNAVDRISDLANDFVYNVGAGLDFETYTACIRALQGDTRKKTVYIHSGTYDIYNETGGAAYWGTFTGNEDDWRQYTDVVPPNTTIIGVGDVYLNFMPSGTGAGAISEDASHVVSPVNLSGTCTLENLTINADNCRYAIHCETSGIADFIGSVYTFKNVRVNRYTTYFTTNRYKHNDAFACGYEDETRFEFDNCEFYADTNGTPFRFHDRGTARATITANNCVIRGNGNNRSMIRLEDVSSNETAHTYVNCSNCFIDGKIHLHKSSGNRNPFDITLLNCGNPVIEIDSEMQNPYTPNIYNQYVYSDNGNEVVIGDDNDTIVLAGKHITFNQDGTVTWTSV